MTPAATSSSSAPPASMPKEQQAGWTTSTTMTLVIKLVATAALLVSGSLAVRQQQQPKEEAPSSTTHRRLSSEGSIPSYMETTMQDLRDRKKLFDETPKEEIKYWFEYPGPLQKYFYRFSKSRAKADYFEGRDDSGVANSRFVQEPGAGPEFVEFFDATSSPQQRLLENCLAMGSPQRPNTSSGLWKEWFGSTSSNSKTTADRCRILFALNTVGAGRGSTILWETQPPKPHAQGPEPWMSEQETAATHLQRNLQEIDAMCASGLIAARVQVLVCEPISARWTEWMDSLLPHCGGQPSTNLEGISMTKVAVEERASPVQVVVVATAATADTCHDLKSGFMEKRMQDLVLAPPYLGDASSNSQQQDPTIKTTHPDLVSSDDHDLYVAFKWTSLITILAVNAFLQASADLAAAASAPQNQGGRPHHEINADGQAVATANGPSSPFLIPSFVRMSYVSEENAKVAKWRMHGDFFHPAAWEICKDSFEATWIEASLAAGTGGVTTSTCPASSSTDCGQWWIYMTELQMPTSPEVYANEVTPPIVQGGSNFVWMLTERQRHEIVKQQVCRYQQEHSVAQDKADCPAAPQAVMPLGDLESFVINFTPNTALGKKHVHGRRPGYSRQAEREAERQQVKERKQLKGDEDIEKALFDYTIYPAALFRKDATLKAARARDAILTATPQKDEKDDAAVVYGPQTVKSSYYDITITKPRPPVLGWCQAIARKGLCVLYADYFRSSGDERCVEACGMKKNWTPIDVVAE